MNEPKPVQPSHSVWTEAFREFDALYEAGMSQRAARLAALRDTAPGLADAVHRLLAEHDARHAAPAHDWLQTLPRGLPAALPGPDQAPSSIGPWRLLRELGHGGTSRVWLARREDVPWLREVALKVPLGGWWRQDLRERLVRERDILSRLEHPHIARLYDAGFAEAQPWLALEYVQGQDIITWCDSRKASLCQRVALFRQVLQAVHYAHSALIVHRDLKPANILVTTDGSVRLLDFGIAKILAEGQDHTQTTQLTEAVGRMLTPAYASPEQLRNEPLTTATDVYSLGLVLYQLLTGVQPCADRPRRAAQIEQAIMEGQLPLASRGEIKDEHAQARGVAVRTLRRMLAGDLDAVLCKATQASPAARYASAAAFDADLESWLAGHPVPARRPTLWQHTVKLVRRRPWASGLGAAAVCALTATAVVAVYQASQARAQAAQARLEASRAKSAKDFLVGLFDEANPDRNGGREVSAREMLMRAEQRIDRNLSGQPEMKVEMLGAMGRVWWYFGDMDNAARVLEQRTRLAAVASPGAGYVDALLDQAGAAVEAGQMATVADRLSAAREVANRSGPLAPALSSRMEWTQAWLAIKGRPPDYPAALRHLDDAERLARQAGDVSLEVDALMVRASAMRLQRRHAEAVSAIGRAEQLMLAVRAASPQAYPESELHPLKLDKARNLFSMGEYRQGWVLADQLMQDVEAWNRRDSNRFGLVQYRLWWLAFMVQLGLTDAAASWVDAHPTDYLALPISDPVASAGRYLWLARLWVARSEWARAAEMIRLGRAVPGVGGSVEGALLLLIEAEAQLRQARTADANRALDELQRAPARAGFAGRLIALDLKSLRSVAEAQSGQWQAARQLAKEAVADAVRDMGEDHPRVARARVNLVLLGWRQPQDEPPQVDATRELALAMPVLRRCYLSTSDPVRVAEALVSASTGLPAPLELIHDPRAFVL
jgi:serine/threonine protein kinase